VRFHLVVRLLILGPEARRTFYFWRTTFALSPAEQ
jgi:hypothetical protein